MRAHLAMLAVVLPLLGPSLSQCQPPTKVPPPGNSPLALNPVPILDAPGPYLTPEDAALSGFGEPITRPGWFLASELAIVAPSLRFRVHVDRAFLDGPVLDLPTTDLSTTVSPTFEVGYRLPGEQGLLAGNYRFLIAEGEGTRDVLGITYQVRTQLDIHSFGFDYGAIAYEVAPRYLLSWRLGAQIADVSFNTRAVSGIVTQEASSNFFGAGPRGRVEIERRIVPLPGLTLFGRLDGAMLVGRVKQTYREDIALPNALMIPTEETGRRSRAVPYLNVQAGLGYVPPALPNLKFTAGYQFEQWWGVGDLGGQTSGALNGSRGEVWTHGAFLRAQVDF